MRGHFFYDRAHGKSLPLLLAFLPYEMNDGMDLRIKGSGMVRSLLTAAAGIWLTGCSASQEELAWQVARDSGSAHDYANYMRQYPAGAHAEEARWEAACRTDTVSAYLDYLKASPATKRAGDIHERIAKAAQKNLTIEDGYAYLLWAGTQANPSKAVTSQQAHIRQKLETLEWEKAREMSGSVGIFLFLKKYPASSRVKDAQTLLADKRYDAVKRLANPYGYRAYLRWYGQDSRAAEIRSLLERSAPSGDAPASSLDARSAVKELMGRDRYFRDYGCALLLADAIQKHPGDETALDALRHQMTALFIDAEKAPADCAAAERLTLDTADARAAVAAAALYLASHQDLADLATRYKAMAQRADLTEKSIAAAAQLSKSLESDELAEGVLGGGALGGMDLGLSEKGSVTASRAEERLRVLSAAAKRNTAEGEALVKKQSAQADGLRLYLASLMKVEP